MGKRTLKVSSIEIWGKDKGSVVLAEDDLERNFKKGERLNTGTVIRVDENMTEIETGRTIYKLV